MVPNIELYDSNHKYENQSENEKCIKYITDNSNKIFFSDNDFKKPNLFNEIIVSIRNIKKEMRLK